MLIHYWQRDAGSGPLTIRISDADGTVVRTLEQPSEPGLGRVFWNLRRDPQPEARRGGLGRAGGDPVAPGEYTITLETAGQRLEQKATVKPAVALPRIAAPRHAPGS